MKQWRLSYVLRNSAALSFLFVLSMILPATVASAIAPTAVDPSQVDKSVVQVTITWNAVVQVPFQDGSVAPYNATQDYLCTGWFVSNVGQIVTAGHCVSDSAAHHTALYQDVISRNQLTGVKAEEVQWPLTIEDPHVKISQPSGVDGGPLSGKNPVTAQVINKQGFENGDNALLRIADMTNTPALAVGTTAPETGERVTTIGFGNLTASVSDVSRQKPSYRTGAVSSRSYSTNGVPATEVDVDIIQGMSGGPAVDQSGAVIGVNSGFVPGQAAQVNFITDTQTLRDFLTANGVKLTEATPAAANGSASPSQVASQSPASSPVARDSSAVPTWMMILVVVLAVALLGMFGYLIYTKRQQTKVSAASAASGERPPLP